MSLNLSPKPSLGPHVWQAVLMHPNPSCGRLSTYRSILGAGVMSECVCAVKGLFFLTYVYSKTLLPRSHWTHSDHNKPPFCCSHQSVCFLFAVALKKNSKWIPSCLLSSGFLHTLDVFLDRWLLLKRLFRGISFIQWLFRLIAYNWYKI